ncbi:pheromone A receptor-domain-containing protein [Pseudoneurospora amorphoporcata]|uniref:Pheromone A receptor-domain-containing protein n=1 Tax=Pseudoneurospora amorphoporcata TaxID=241081 RepID=A0AAN6SCP7_9PEZI|nr:pheromone A receptor-domain-containing protein [Pseudoneurospora amorphoporcata]
MNNTFYTTTPQERHGPPAPYTDIGLQVNLFFRVFLGLLGMLIPLVPAKLLWINGEFGATVHCMSSVALNFFYVVNSLIWRDNNVKKWYGGYGWCDFHTYVFFAVETIFHTTLFDIMLGLANKIGNPRVTSLSPKEKQRKDRISALIIFGNPVLQVLLTYFVILQRYNVSTLAGCNAVFDPNGVFLVFFILPSPIFTVGAAGLAGACFYKYRQLEKLTREAIPSDDSIRTARQKRLRRKLYFLTLSILVSVVPLVCVFFVFNVAQGWPWSLPFDLHRIHASINFVSFTTTEKMKVTEVLTNYVPVVSAVAICITFGTTVEAYNQYRLVLVFLGFGKLWPKLYQEYDPDDSIPPCELCTQTSSKSWWSSMTKNNKRGTVASFSLHDTSILPITEDIPLTTRLKLAPTKGESSHTNPSSPYDELRKEFPDLWPTQSSPTAKVNNNNNPWPDLSVDPTPPARNPWYLRPNAFHVPIRLPMPLSPIYIPSLHADQDKKTERKQKRASVNRLSTSYTALSGSSTPHLPPSNSPNCPLPSLPTSTSSARHPPQEERHRSTIKHQKKKESAMTQDNTTNAVPAAVSSKPAAPWSPFASDHKNTTLGVDTRVWSSQKENNKEDHYTAAHTQDSSVIHQTISHSSRSTGPQLSPPPSYSVAMGESSFASTSDSQPGRPQIGTALGHPLGHPPRGGVMVGVETEIESSCEVIGGRERGDGEQLGEKE